MQIWCYCPTNKFVRLYILVMNGASPQDFCQDGLWEQIKRKARYIRADEESCYWDSPQEQAEERASWFVDWNNPRSWSEEGLVAIDTHY